MAFCLSVTGKMWAADGVVYVIETSIRAGASLHWNLEFPPV